MAKLTPWLTNGGDPNYLPSGMILQVHTWSHQLDRMSEILKKSTSVDRYFSSEGVEIFENFSMTSCVDFVYTLEHQHFQPKNGDDFPFQNR